LEELGVDGRVVLELILGEWDGKVCTGFMWCRTGTSDRFLWTR